MELVERDNKEHTVTLKLGLDEIGTIKHIFNHLEDILKYNQPFDEVVLMRDPEEIIKLMDNFWDCVSEK
jgi:hypothetical protein